MTKANIRNWLEEVETIYGETIEAIVVGEHDDRRYRDPAQSDENVVLSREDGLTKVDQEFDNGFGGADCYPVYAWTKSRVFFVHEYDGATGLNYVPRNPTPVETAFGGTNVVMEKMMRVIAERKGKQHHD